MGRLHAIVTVLDFSRRKERSPFEAGSLSDDVKIASVIDFQAKLDLVSRMDFDIPRFVGGLIAIYFLHGVTQSQRDAGVACLNDRRSARRRRLPGLSLDRGRRLGRVRLWFGFNFSSSGGLLRLGRSWFLVRVDVGNLPCQEYFLRARLSDDLLGLFLLG